jgi:hypothetical protein
MVVRKWKRKSFVTAGKTWTPLARFSRLDAGWGTVVLLEAFRLFSNAGNQGRPARSSLILRERERYKKRRERKKVNREILI